MRFLDRLCDFGLLNKERIVTDGEVRGYVVYLATRHGLAYMSDIGIDHNINVINKSNISISTLIHSFDLQCLHAACISNDYHSWQKPDYLFRKKGTHYSDALAVNNGLNIAFELERFLKTPSRYDGLFSHYANEIFEGRVDKVYYVCPYMNISNKIKSYFNSIEMVVCGDNKFKTNDALFKRFLFVDYDYFGF